VAWYGAPLPLRLLDERQDQFDFWFEPVQPGENVILMDWSELSIALPIRQKNGLTDDGFETCSLLERVETRHLGRRLSHFDLYLCSNWQGSQVTERPRIKRR
jgi:hypothetical protein